jgi:VanZ family protein
LRELFVSFGRSDLKRAYYQILGWIAVVSIAILSLVPGQLRPHIFALGAIEHLTAYFLAATLLALGYRSLSSAIWIALLLGAYSGGLEVLQHWIPGRSPKLSDFVISSSGAFAGVVVASLMLRINTGLGR